MTPKKTGDGLRSMTGYASLSGDAETARWDWEIRSVNGKGIDLRFRLPEGSDALEAMVRTAVSGHAARGNVTVSLRVTDRHPQGLAELDRDGLTAALIGLEAIENEAHSHGIALATMTAADIASMPGVMVAAAREKREMPADIAAQIPDLLHRFSAMRAAEGAQLGQVIAGQLDAVADLVVRARNTAEARAARQGTLLRERVEALTSATDLADPARLNQELALLAVKADVTEEVDRLDAHVAAARALLNDGGPVGRKLDFLMQEFNREANTLCSKSGSAELTAIGLDMKVIIDQMREQVQNLE